MVGPPGPHYAEGTTLRYDTRFRAGGCTACRGDSIESRGCEGSFTTRSVRLSCRVISAPALPKSSASDKPTADVPVVATEEVASVHDEGICLARVQVEDARIAVELARQARIAAQFEVERLGSTAEEAEMADIELKSADETVELHADNTSKVGAEAGVRAREADGRDASRVRFAQDLDSVDAAAEETPAREGIKEVPTRTLPAGWTQYIHRSGCPFYSDGVTTQWEFPEAPAPESVEADRARDGDPVEAPPQVHRTERALPDGWAKYLHESGYVFYSNGVETQWEFPEADKLALAAGWEKVESVTTGKEYWWNPETDESSWDNQFAHG